jgi:two-component system response regulator FixJ
MTGGENSATHFIYVIDDDREVRASIVFMLGAEGRATRPFGSGHEFLEALPELAPGCILLDVRMAGMNGLEVLAELESRKIGWPVIVMTGHGEDEIATEAIKLGALDFLEKPFMEGTLLSCLDRSCHQLEN